MASKMAIIETDKESVYAVAAKADPLRAVENTSHPALSWCCPIPTSRVGLVEYVANMHTHYWG
jgi:hypothetical protein